MEARAAAPKTEAKKNVNLLQMFVVLLSIVCSGPSGIEGAVGAGGISLALGGIVLFPTLWTLGQSLTATELTLQYSAVNGGLPAWCLQQGNRLLALNTALWELVILMSTAAVVSENTSVYIRVVCQARAKERERGALLL